MIIISAIESAYSTLVWSIALWHRLVEEILFVLDSPPSSRVVDSAMAWSCGRDIVRS